MEAWAREVGNLSTEGANQRLQRGIVMLGVALILAIVLVYLDLHSAWRAVLFVPFFVSANLFYSGLHRTWMGCASRGQRETEDLEQVKVIDPERVARAAATSKRIVREALITAVAVTLLFVTVV